MSFVIFYKDIVSNIFWGGFSLWRPSPRQFPHTATQYSPFFSHEQFVEQGRFEKSLHLQLTNLSQSAGAASCSVYTGWYNPLQRNQSHSKGSMWASFRYFQSITSSYTQKECYWAVFSEEGSDSILISSFVAAISIYLEYLIISCDSSRIVELQKVHETFKLLLMRKPLRKKLLENS